MLSSWAFVSINFVNDPFQGSFFLEFTSSSSSSGFSNLTFTEPDADQECDCVKGEGTPQSVGGSRREGRNLAWVLGYFGTQTLTLASC